jgi:hypothetical protein
MAAAAAAAGAGARRPPGSLLETRRVGVSRDHMTDPPGGNERRLVSTPSGGLMADDESKSSEEIDFEKSTGQMSKTSSLIALEKRKNAAAPASESSSDAQSIDGKHRIRFDLSDHSCGKYPFVNWSLALALASTGWGRITHDFATLSPVTLSREYLFARRCTGLG